MVHPDRSTVASTATLSKIVMAKPPVVERSRTNRIFQKMKRILPRFYLVLEVRSREQAAPKRAACKRSAKSSDGVIFLFCQSLIFDKDTLLSIFVKPIRERSLLTRNHQKLQIPRIAISKQFDKFIKISCEAARTRTLSIGVFISCHKVVPRQVQSLQPRLHSPFLLGEGDLA